METIVPHEYKTSKEVRVKKSQQLAFRRWMNGESGGNIIQQYVGVDILTVREWFAGKMVNGMTWNNYGKDWVIDHIVPIRMFDVMKEDELKICWHYKNLMPLFKEDNLKKEGNVFFAFILLNKIKGDDYYYNKLYERILPEIDSMNKYITTYCESPLIKVA